MMKKNDEQITENQENRDTARMDHVSPVQVQDIESGKIHRARMFNYSKEGVYFESDSVLEPGMQIYIGIKDSPYAVVPDVLEYHLAQIMWRKILKDSFYRYGYGIKLSSFADKPDSEPKAAKAVNRSKDLRKHPRKPYEQFTLFTTQNGIFEGSIKNISSSGVFLTARSTFKVGQTLTLLLPLKNGKEVKVKGRIVWTNDSGFGVKFLNVEKK